MADNRMYIYCPKCGHSLYLAKSFAGPFTLGEENRERMNEFMVDHFWTCMQNPYVGTLFELRYENGGGDESKEVPDYSKCSHDGAKLWKKEDERMSGGCAEPRQDVKEYLAYRDNKAACAFWELSNFIARADTLDEVKTELARLERKLRGEE